MTTQTVESLLLDARRELENGDRVGASEKGWEAIEHTLKAVAARRGWKYDNEMDAYPIVKRLEAEMDGDRLYLMFNAARYAYRNYLIDAIPMEDLLDWLEDVDEFIAMLNEASRG